MRSPLGAVAGGAEPGGSGDVWHRQYNSWGVEVVIPERVPLAGGRELSWSSARDITGVVTLPNITKPDAITYVVLSAMGSDRSVFQVAAGAWPGSAHWSVYSWYITDVGSQTPSYQWVANSTGPGISSGDQIALCIARSLSGWTFAVLDHRAGTLQEGYFPANSSVSFASGDQEVVALESYSRSSSTFREMGNLTLQAVMVDGARIEGGWYFYSGWNPLHTPLFEVGGSQVPVFISLTSNAQGEAVWGYTSQWTNVSLDPPFVGVLASSVVLCLSAFVGLAAAWHASRPRSPKLT